MRSFVLLVFALGLCSAQHNNMMSLCVSSNLRQSLTCMCNNDYRDIDGKDFANMITSDTKLLYISQCGTVRLSADTFHNNNNSINEIRIESTKELFLDAKLPSDVEKITIKNVAMVHNITNNCFESAQILKHLHIENSAVENIEADTFGELNMHSAIFRNVTFLGLSESSLNIHFSSDESLQTNESLRTEKAFEMSECSFLKVEYETQVVFLDGYNNSIVFFNNSLQCENIMADYLWLAKLFENQMKHVKEAICYYLYWNYCGEMRTPENRLISRLYSWMALSNDTGIQLREFCTEPSTILTDAFDSGTSSMARNRMSATNGGMSSTASSFGMVFVGLSIIFSSCGW